jgi:branched-chain amino acid transport system substrate-binding protein
MRFTRRLFGASVAATAALGCSLAFAQSGQTVRIAFMDPLSGPFANVGQNQ